MSASPARSTLAARLREHADLHRELAAARGPLERLEQAKSALQGAEAELRELETADAQAMSEWAESGDGGSPPRPTDRTKIERRIAEAKAQAAAAESVAGKLNQRVAEVGKRLTAASAEIPAAVDAVMVDEAREMVNECIAARARVRKLELRVDRLISYFVANDRRTTGRELIEALNAPVQTDFVKESALESEAWRAFAAALGADPRAEYQPPA